MEADSHKKWERVWSHLHIFPLLVWESGFARL